VHLCGVPEFAHELAVARVESFVNPVFIVREELSSIDPAILAYFGGAPIDLFDYLNLRFLQLLMAGTDHVDLHYCRRRGIQVATSGPANASTVAEQTIMLILALLRKLKEQEASLRLGTWQDGVPLESLDTLGNKTVGVVGFGNIGSRVAMVASALGARVIYTDLVPKDTPFSYVPYSVLIESSDVITFHVPLTESTRGMLSEREIARMRRGSLIVNTSRGAVVDENAILGSLDGGRLGGAAFDVFAQEPPECGRFEDVPNLIVTPHRAGASPESWKQRLDIFAGNLERWQARNGLLYRVA
jgi:phosphoglycerate dehydrogenase-like enzyme